MSIIFQFHIPETAVPTQIISQDSPGLEDWGVSTGWKGGGGGVGGLARVLMKKIGVEVTRIHNLYSRATNETLQKKKQNQR
ncbi:hypothetical protein PP707_08125 [Acetobacter pasteurianus]|nr:hypothetical protein [Acetobacter pasteurianus]